MDTLSVFTHLPGIPGSVRVRSGHSVRVHALAWYTWFCEGT